jgi:hypothetical protein
MGRSSKTEGHRMEAERFVNFYESKGWMVGKNKMKDWRAAVRNWARTSQQQTPKTNKATPKKDDDAATDKTILTI